MSPARLELFEVPLDLRNNSFVGNVRIIGKNSVAFSTQGEGQGTAKVSAGKQLHFPQNVRTYKNQDSSPYYSILARSRCPKFIVCASYTSIKLFVFFFKVKTLQWEPDYNSIKFTELETGRALVVI